MWSWSRRKGRYGESSDFEACEVLEEPQGGLRKSEQKIIVAGENNVVIIIDNR